MKPGKSRPGIHGPKIKQFLATIALTLLLAAPAYAANYRVEVVIFRDLRPVDNSGPPLQIQRVDTANAVDMDNRQALVNNGIHLKSGGLGGIWKALRGSKNYHPMLRVSWTQLGRSRGNGIPLRIHDSKTYSMDNAQNGQHKLHGLDGTAELIAEPYLQLRLNLILLRPQAQGQADGLSAYHLHSSRAVDSGKLYYFDNPAFGAIARVTKLQ